MPPARSSYKDAAGSRRFACGKEPWRGHGHSDRRCGISCAARGAPRRPLKVGVLVDLALTPEAGGHVKCWQRFAEAAVGYPDRLDLTVHFQGPQPRRIELSSSVRYELLPPVLSTARWSATCPTRPIWRAGIRGSRRASAYDVIHTTDAFFCYARTAARFARRSGVPVVSSIHTEHARIRPHHDGQAARTQTGNGFGVPGGKRLPAPAELGRRRAEPPACQAPGRGDLVDRGLCRRAGGRRRTWPSRHLSAPRSRPRSIRPGAARPSLVRAAFWAAGRSPDCHVCRASSTPAKMCRCWRRLLRRPAAGVPVHLVCAGAGAARPVLEAALGPALTCCGPLPQAELARAYASADLFLFPSMIDEFGNAGVEALASGLPALLAAGSGIATRMADCTGLRVFPGDDPAPWVAAIVELAGRRCAAPRWAGQRAPMWKRGAELGRSTGTGFAAGMAGGGGSAG